MANKSTDKKCEIIWEQKTYEKKQKQVMKCTMNHGDCISGTQVDMDAIQHEGTGLIWSEDDNKVHVGYRAVWNYNANTLAHNMALHYGGKAFGETAKMYLHSDFAATFKDLWTYNAMKVLNQMWIVDGDVSAGIRFEYDFTKKNIDALRFEGQYNIDKDSAVWGHVAYKNKFAALAYDNTFTMAKVAIRHTSMLTASWDEKVKQFYGTPVGFRFGSEAKISKDMKVVSNWGFSSQLFFNCNMTTTVKKNWDLGVHFHYKGDRQGQGSSPIESGLELHYKCDDLFTDM